MSCSNCFNGCSEITSDQCVRYTGIDVPVLGIKTGDSLSYVEQALIEFLTSTLDGTGIKPNIDPTIICKIVKDYLPTCGDLTVVDFITALIKAACALQVEIDAIVAELAVIEAPYTIGCLTGVTSTSGTHTILQAVITKLCTVETNLAALTLNVATNYVALADLDTLIAAYLASLNPGGNVYLKDRMIPYTAVEYYPPAGDLSLHFDGTGRGVGDYDRLFICNGLNGTPDKRGRVAVGAIKGITGPALDAAVDPTAPVVGIFNPNYDLNDKVGSNSIFLSTSQMPKHNHNVNLVSTITPASHNHGVTATSGDGYPDGSGDRGGDYPVGSQTLNVALAVTTTGTISDAGSSAGHANNQPVLACYYIMYIP